jgi:2'-5' RNA ligase
MIRLFTGIAVPQAVNARLDDLVRRLKPLARIRWSPASNFHITTKFIGAWPEDRLEILKQALACPLSTGAFRIAVRGVGFFPRARAPHIFYAGIEGGEPLSALASQTDKICAKLEIAPEKRAYSPHLTLAKIGTPPNLDALHAAIAQDPALEFGAFDVTAFHLFLSHPTKAGTIYTSLAEFPL